MLLRALILAHVIAGASAHAAIPVVYADDHIEIGAAVAEAGAKPMHLGDELTLVVEAEFDPDVVQVESLSADWFRRTFAELTAVALLSSNAPQTLEGRRGGVRLVARFHFQVIGCPPELANCPGRKRYELPLASVAYRLTSDAGATAERSARFTPWPGRIDLVAAIPFEPSGGTSIADVIPGGAWPAPVAFVRDSGSDTVLLLAGALLLVSGFAAGRRRRELPLSAGRHATRDKRWQRAARALEDPALGDDAWAEQIRRCITWYCQDELGQNPVEWLRTGNPTADPATSDCRQLYLDVLAEEGIEMDRRESFRRRWARTTGSERMTP